MKLAMDILLAAGTVVTFIGCCGVLFAADVFRRLHWLNLASALPALCFVAAILLRQGAASAGWKALLISGLLIFGSAVLSHATARAAWIRPRGHWEPPPASPSAGSRT